jgi:hypothetical protein
MVPAPGGYLARSAHGPAMVAALRPPHLVAVGPTGRHSWQLTSSGAREDRDMQDADLFFELAGIAGVFVGFGALIAVRTGGVSDTFEVAYMRGVVSMGLLTIVAALAPVTLSRYPLDDHQVWALSSVVVLVGFLVSLSVNAWTPEYRADMTLRVWATLPRWLVVAGLASVGVMAIWIVLVPIVILLDLAPELEAALYFSTVVLMLLWAGWLLLQMVFRGRQPADA